VRIWPKWGSLRSENVEKEPSPDGKLINLYVLLKVDIKEIELKLLIASKGLWAANLFI
jgi:hypothetical protein